VAASSPYDLFLRTDGLNVWFDEWAFKPGDNIPVKIEDKLEQSPAIPLSHRIGEGSTGERDRLRCRIPQRTANLVVRKHLPDVLKLPPIPRHGNVNEIIGKFGGADQLRAAVNQLQSLLYATLLQETNKCLSKPT